MRKGIRNEGEREGEREKEEEEEDERGRGNWVHETCSINIASIVLWVL
jgi:hypothetical protein